MKFRGMEIIQERKGTGVVGFTEVLPEIVREKKIFNKVREFINVHKIDAAILFDNPGFNLPLSKILYHKGIRVFYFSPPQVWAWGEKRIQYLRKYIEINLVTLPFEEEYYRKNGVNAVSVGHPAVLLKPREKQNIIVFLPGSRENEIKQLIPRLGRVLQEWAKERDFSLKIAFPSSLSQRWIDFARRYISDGEFFIGKTYKILSSARIGVICSGTATLEAVFTSTPALVIYRLSPLTYFIGKSLLKTRYIGLPNIMMKREVQKEVIQYQLKPKVIWKALDWTLKNQSEIIKNYNIIEQKFGKENVYEKASEILYSLI